MKKVLFATTALVAMAGAAQAGVTLAGDARLGLIYDGNDTVGTSRARVQFIGEGTTNSGLTFGFKFRTTDLTRSDDGNAAASPANQGPSGNVSSRGEVYISGAFGSLTYGDTDSAAAKRNPHVSGVGLTGLGDLNELNRGPQGAGRIRYDYDMGNYGFSVSTEGALETWAIGASASFGNFTVGLGYDDDDGVDSTLVASAAATFGSITGKVAYRDGDVTGEDYALSLGWDSGSGLGVTAFARDGDNVPDTVIGIGASYDLGGGASVVGGIVDDGTDTVADFGISMTF